MVEFTIYADDNLIYSSTDPEFGGVLQPKLKLEINKSGSLSFTMLPNHEHYDDLHPMRTLVLVIMNEGQTDEEILFRGRVVEVKTDFYKQKNVDCEGDLSFLLDSVITPYRYSGSNKQTIRQILKKFINDHNGQMTGDSSWKQFRYDDNYITVTTDGSENYDTAKDYWESTSYGNTWNAITSQLIDVYGGIVRTRTVRSNVGFTTYLDYIKDPNQSLQSYPINEQAIEFGVNLLDIEAAYPVSDIFTVLMPIGSEKLTISSVNNNSPYLENSEAIAKFGRIVKVQQWSDIKKASALKDKAQKYMSTHGRIFSDDLTIKAIDLHYLNPSKSLLKLCDRVRVYSEPHGIGTDGNDMVLLCLSVDYDLEKPENNSYSLGTYISEEKDKGKLSGGSGGSKGSSKSSKTLTGQQAGTSKEVADTKEETIDNKAKSEKGILGIVGDKAKSVFGIDSFDEGASVEEKTSQMYEKMGTGNNSEGLSDIDGITELMEHIKYTESKDPTTGEIITAFGVKNLSETTDDIVVIEGDIVRINGDLVEINSDITSINSRKITIGTGEGSEIIFNGDVNFTNAITKLIVGTLSASRISTITISVGYRINAGVIEAERLEVGLAAIVPTYNSTMDVRSAINAQYLQSYLNSQVVPDLKAWVDDKHYTSIKTSSGDYHTSLSMDLKFLNDIIDNPGKYMILAMPVGS